MITPVLWAIYLTYVITAAVIAEVPHLPAAPRGVVVSALTFAGVAVLLQLHSARLVAQLRRPELGGIHPDVLDAGLRIKRRLGEAE